VYETSKTPSKQQRMNAMKTSSIHISWQGMAGHGCSINQEE